MARLVTMLLAAAIAVCALSLTLGASGASAAACRAPGTVGRVHVYSLSEHGIGCHNASEGLFHYLHTGKSPLGYTCDAARIGTHDTRLSCFAHYGSFHASWRRGPVTE